jgi:GT2 family glycosyltransferase
MMSRLSIIVTVLNKAALIEGTLRSLPEFRAKGAEVIVVDGGSSDDTLTRARPLADQVLASPQGRAPDESGSKLCNWDLLLFLHANTHQKG